jgi:hypothetical protein
MKRIILATKSVIGAAFFLVLLQNADAQSIPGNLTFKLGKYEAYLNPETISTSAPQLGAISAKGGITFQLPTPQNNISKIRILFFGANVIHRQPSYDTSTQTLTYYRTSDDYNSYLEIIRLSSNVTITFSTDPLESLLVTASN